VASHDYQAANRTTQVTVDNYLYFGTGWVYFKVTAGRTASRRKLVQKLLNSFLLLALTEHKNWIIYN